MRSPKDFFRPLAVGAPDPVREIPFRPSRMIHFFPLNEDGRQGPEMRTVDVLLANLGRGPCGRQGGGPGRAVEVSQGRHGRHPVLDQGPLLDSPWGLDDLVTAVTEVGEALDVVMIPKVEGPEDIRYVDRLLAQPRRRSAREPLLVRHPGTRGVGNVEEICAASPRMQGLSLGPADLAANRRMKTTRVGGGHPGYVVRKDPDPEDPDAPRPTYQQDLWHYTIARMVDACRANDVLPYYGPFGDIKDTTACEDQFRNAYLLGCVGAWSLHPVQIAIAKKVFSPDPADVAHAQRVIEAMGDGTGALMLDGKMEDDASVKQCQVMVQLAHALADGDPELAAAYGFETRGG
ncbi:MAG: CoA ester lyase [Acidimicrobiales bacterium]